MMQLGPPPPPDFPVFCKIPRENGHRAKILYSRRKSCPPDEMPRLRACIFMI